MLLSQTKIVHSIILFALFFISLTTQSQVVKGKVIDVNTGEPLTGAIVNIIPANTKTIVKLDGTFITKNLKPGSYQLQISYSNYVTYTQNITLSSNDVVINEIQLSPSNTDMAGVVVSSAINGSDKNIRSLEKKSNQLVNILSAKNIQLLPDITVANVLQRVSGVTIEKSGSGEARYPVIRGMEKRYINTLVNGIKIPSPDNKNRFIPLDLFPSELLERLEVSKSLTPSMEGDAIGGTINLVMKAAPEHRIFNVNVAAGYNNIFGRENFSGFNKKDISKLSPAEINGTDYIANTKEFSLAHLNYNSIAYPVNSTLGLTVGNRLGKDRKFGYILSASSQNIFRGTTSNFFLPNSQPAFNNIPLFSDLQLRKYSVHSNRKGFNGKADYRINNRNNISLAGTFARLDDYQARIIYDTVALNSVVDNKFRSTWQYQSIANATLQGNHQLNTSVKLDWGLVYSVAQNHVPDQAEFIHQYSIIANSTSNDIVQSATHTWAHNKDKDLSAYFNIAKETHLFGQPIEIKLGGLERNKVRDNFYYAYSLTTKTVGQKYSSINAAQLDFKDVKDGRPDPNGNNYNFKENVAAGYLQAKWQLSKKLEALGGVRIENTQQEYKTALSIYANARLGKINYTDVLPSVQLKYVLAKNQQLRLAYYKALARPGFAELIPDGVPGEFFREQGDPVNLQHSVADNIDLRYELYSNSADQILLGAFYKNIKDPIEISAIKPNAINSLYLQPVNIGTATNYGVEAVITKYFGNFGIALNYTYTKSSITNDSLLFSSAITRTTTRVAETRPLQGQSNHIGNASIIYKNAKIGLDLQTAFVYTGERISFISPYLGLNYWQSPTTQLDFSFEKRVIHHFSFYGKINNITNAPYQIFLRQSYNEYLKSGSSRVLALQTDADNKIIIQKDFYKTSFLFGLRYKL